MHRPIAANALLATSTSASNDAAPRAVRRRHVGLRGERESGFSIVAAVLARPEAYA
jgi:hypothetical protein